LSLQRERAEEWLKALEWDPVINLDEEMAELTVEDSVDDDK
jgi:hypothetical protein